MRILDPSFRLLLLLVASENLCQRELEEDKTAQSKLRVQLYQTTNVKQSDFTMALLNNPGIFDIIITTYECSWLRRC